VQVVVLRLLRAERPEQPGGQVSYLAELSSGAVSAELNSGSLQSKSVAKVVATGCRAGASTQPAQDTSPANAATRPNRCNTTTSLSFMTRKACLERAEK
jgi:hypothetical protein